MNKPETDEHRRMRAAEDECARLRDGLARAIEDACNVRGRLDESKSHVARLEATIRRQAGDGECVGDIIGEGTLSWTGCGGILRLWRSWATGDLVVQIDEHSAVLLDDDDVHGLAEALKSSAKT